MKKTFFYFTIISIICFSSTTVYATQNTYNVEANIFDTMRELLVSIQEQFIAAQTLFKLVVIEQKSLSFTPSDKALEDQAMSFFKIDKKNVSYEIPGSFREQYQQIPLVPGTEDVSRGRAFRIDTEVNDAPFFSSFLQRRTIRPEQNFIFLVQAEDLEQDTLTYRVKNLPPGAKFDTKTGKFMWKPSAALVGNTYIVTVIVKDSHGKETSEKLYLSVENPTENDSENNIDDFTDDNTAPLFNSIDGDFFGVVGEKIIFTISATDEDDDFITYSIETALPNGAIFSSETGIFSWIPSADQAGYNKMLKFKATDSRGASDYQEVEISVESQSDDNLDDSDISNNHEPILKYIGNKENILIGEKLAFEISATDEDSDILSLEVFEFPDNNYTINPHPTQRNRWYFSWVPEKNSYYNNDIVDAMFSVNDGELEDSEMISISMKGEDEISNENHAPYFKNLPTSTINIQQGDNFIFHIVGNDEDDDLLNLTKISITPNDVGTEIFSDADDFYAWDFVWTPQNLGKFIVQFSLYDGTTTTIRSVTFNVVTSCSLPKQSPSFDEITLPANIMVGEAIQFPVRAHIPSGENIYLTVSPENFSGMSFIKDSENTKIFSLVPQLEYVNKNISFKFTAVGNECTIPKTKIISFHISSEKKNNLPQFSETIKQQHTVREMTEITFDVVAQDIDNDPITYGVLNMPQGAIATLLKKDGENSGPLSRKIITFLQQANLLQNTNSSEQDPSFKSLGIGKGIRFSWTPALGQGRIDPYVVTFRAYDGKEESLLQITIIVNKNNSPQFNSTLSSQIMMIDTQSSFTIPSASDSDGDIVQYTFNGMNPPSSISPSFSPITRLFSWAPSSPGSFTATFSAYDGKGGVVSLPVTIIVKNLNHLPVFTSDTPQSVLFQVGVQNSFTVSATDADNDVIKYSWDQKPDGIFDDITKTFTWMPKDIGTYYAEFTVDDGSGEVVTKSIEIIAVTEIKKDQNSEEGAFKQGRLETILGNTSFNILNFFKHLFTQ